MKPRLIPLACLTFVAAWLLANLLSGCTFTTRPVQPVESKASCEDVTRNLERLPDACGVDLSTFVADCEAASEAERDLGIAFPRDCMADPEKDCAAIKACR